MSTFIFREDYQATTILTEGEVAKLKIGMDNVYKKEMPIMSQKRKRHSAEFKAKIALEAVKGLKSSGELAKEYQVHPNQISQWKRQLLEMIPEVFRHSKATPEVTEQALTAPLHQEIGRLKMEALDWIKKYCQAPRKVSAC